MKKIIKKMTPNNIGDYLADSRFHSEEKGCVMKTFSKKGDKGQLLNRYCKTHNVYCSKTGWEIGWYRGTDSKKIWQDDIPTFNFVCPFCGKQFKTKINYKKYCCLECKVLANIERTKMNRKKYSQK